MQVANHTDNTHVKHAPTRSLILFIKENHLFV